MPDIDPAAPPPSPDAVPVASLATVRIWLWAAIALLLLIGLASLMPGWIRSDSRAPNNIASAYGGQFELVDRTGQTVSNRTLAGTPYAIFFGFTRCPDVCPTSLSRMAQLRGQMGADGMKFRIIFVSVDPAHDSPETVGNFVDLFGTPILGLTGSEAQIAAAKKGFGIYAERVPLDPANPAGDYTIDHTAAIFLMNGRGELTGTIDHAEPDDSARDKLARLVS